MCILIWQLGLDYQEYQEPSEVLIFFKRACLFLDEIWAIVIASGFI